VSGNYKALFRRVVAAGGYICNEFVLASNTVINKIAIGGLGACKLIVNKYVAATFSLISGFNSSGDVSAWTNTGIGDATLTSWSYATDQSTEGTGSAKFTFTKSDSNNYPELTYTFPSALNSTLWRYISAKVRVTVAAGGVQSRTVQIRLTSGTAVRIWQVVGTTTSVPFSTEQWVTVSGELESPHATGGTGTFDPNNITSISLRLTDGGNKTGSIWWDDVRVYGALTEIEAIYSNDGSTRSLEINDFALTSGETLLLCLKNTGAAAYEIQGEAFGVTV
jgi:hypothetical protein